MRGALRIIAVAAGAGLVAGCALLSPRGETRTFVLINETGRAITAIHVVEAGSAGPGPNLVTGGISLGQGDRAELEVRTAGCAVDVTVRVAGDEEPIEARGFDLCAGQPYVTPRLMSFETNGAAAARPARARARTGAVRGAPTSAPPPPERGLPICPGDSRCKKD